MHYLKNLLISRPVSGGGITKVAPPTNIAEKITEVTSRKVSVLHSLSVMPKVDLDPPPPLHVCSDGCLVAVARVGQTRQQRRRRKRKRSIKKRKMDQR